MAGAEPPAAQRTCGLAAILVFLTALVSGTGATLASKVLFDMDVENSAGETVKFTKPLMATFIMFVAMGLALPLHVVLHVCTHGLTPLAIPYNVHRLCTFTPTIEPSRQEHP